MEKITAKEAYETAMNVHTNESNSFLSEAYEKIKGASKKGYFNSVCFDFTELPTIVQESIYKDLRASGFTCTRQGTALIISWEKIS